MTSERPRSSSGIFTGGCNCGGVTYEVRGGLREIVACHCGQCRRQTGIFYAATDAYDSDLTINDSGSLRWYSSSDFARRGFCGLCGSALFWKRDASDTTSILAGSLDGSPDLTIGRHIYCSDKGVFYEIDDDLPKHPQTD